MIIVIRQEENYRNLFNHKRKKYPCLVILDGLMLLKALCVLIVQQGKIQLNLNWPKL